MTSTPQETSPEKEAEREAEPAPETPYVVVTIQTTGIHPSTGRIVSLDAVTFTEDFTPAEKFHQVINPGERVDPGPVHQHGLSHEQVAAGKKFGAVLRRLDALLEDRTLIVHDLPFVWGFLVSESKRAMNAADRANRSRNRRGGRGGRTRRRRKIGHVPRPAVIVDTLDSAFRTGTQITDIRPGAVARALGMNEPRAGATTARAKRSERDTSREATMIVSRLAARLREDTGWLTVYEPEDLRADGFGLQRSQVRVDAAEAPRPVDNPGVFDPEEGLKPGMEFVVTNEVTVDPDELIAAAMRAGLSYTEKLSRQTSIAVGNLGSQLRGKAMHAARKDIPIVTDREFLGLLAELDESRSDGPAGAARRGD